MSGTNDHTLARIISDLEAPNWSTPQSTGRGQALPGTVPGSNTSKLSDGDSSTWRSGTSVNTWELVNVFKKLGSSRRQDSAQEQRIVEQRALRTTERECRAEMRVHQGKTTDSTKPKSRVGCGVVRGGLVHLSFSELNKRVCQRMNKRSTNHTRIWDERIHTWYRTQSTIIQTKQAQLTTN